MSAEALARIDAALAEFGTGNPDLVLRYGRAVAVLREARALIPEPPTVASVEEWSAAMDAERQRQVEHGYDDAHDSAHGPAHLLTWAIDYARRGRVLEAATIMRSALHMLSAEPPIDDEREAVAREIYRSFYPGDVNTPDSLRSAESDAREFDRAYEIWDAGREGYAPGVRCRKTADRILASPVWRNRHRRPITDEAVTSADEAYVIAMQRDPRPWFAMRAALDAAEAHRA